jgi:hypothetical protein
MQAMPSLEDPESLFHSGNASGGPTRQSKSLGGSLGLLRRTRQPVYRWAAGLGRFCFLMIRNRLFRLFLSCFDCRGSAFPFHLFSPAHSISAQWTNDENHHVQIRNRGSGDTQHDVARWLPIGEMHCDQEPQGGPRPPDYDEEHQLKDVQSCARALPTSRHDRTVPRCMRSIGRQHVFSTAGCGVWQHQRATPLQNVPVAMQGARHGDGETAPDFEVSHHQSRTITRRPFTFPPLAPASSGPRQPMRTAAFLGPPVPIRRRNR